MNNRGKPLTRLELLKNRLIYLSTLAPGDDSPVEQVKSKMTPEQQKVRANVNAVWRTIYEELDATPTFHWTTMNSCGRIGYSSLDMIKTKPIPSPSFC